MSRATIVLDDSDAVGPNSLPPVRRVRRRLDGNVRASEEAILVALQVSDNDVERAARLVQEQHQHGRAARGKEASSSGDAGRAAQENEDAQMARSLAAQQETEAKVEAAPAMLAAQLCESLRDAPGLPRGSVVNYDLAVAFLERLAREIARSRGFGLRIVYHGTSSAGNYRAIIDANLQVPDGQSVLHANDSGYYGKGIYTSPVFSVAQGYAGDGGPVFVCLSLPGRMARVGRCDGRGCKAGYDSHSGNQDTEHVFFSSDQLLPCCLVDASTLDAANAAVLRTIVLIESATRARNLIANVRHADSCSEFAKMHPDYDPDGEYDEEADYEEAGW
jgi:hypothetical protein